MADCWGVGTLILEMMTLEDVLLCQGSTESREFMLQKLKHLEELTELEVELLAGLLHVDPQCRSTASSAIGLPYFDECTIKGDLMRTAKQKPPRRILKAKRTIANT